MKKKFTKATLVAVFCLTAGYTAYDSQNKNEKLSDVMLENVEALAQNETGSGWYLLNVTQNSHSCLWGGYFSCI